MEQVLLGGEEFVEEMRSLLQGDQREQPAIKGLQKRPSWEEILRAVEKVKGEKWESFRDRHGDRGRDLAFYVGRREGGISLRELGRHAGGADYGSEGMALHRFEKLLTQDPSLQKAYQKVKIQL
jgi:hypothetical protein